MKNEDKLKESWLVMKTTNQLLIHHLKSVFTQPLHHRQGKAQSQILGREQIVYIQNNPSPRPVSPVCINIYPST